VKNLIVAIENCETTTTDSPVVKKALEVADAFSSRIWLVHVVPPSRQPPYNIDSKVSRHEAASELRNEHDYLQYLAKCMESKKTDVNALLVQGTIVGSLLKEAARLESDLVIMGCHKHGRLYGALMDSAEEGLLSKCPCPIMFVPY
jgi:nucleotide-binding universal stress UspA family protein